MVVDGVKLRLANDLMKEEVLAVIGQFWLAHNGELPDDEVISEDFEAWTSSGNRLYLVEACDQLVGFAHLGARGGAIDWLEELFILPAYQRHGLGRQVLALLEEEVRSYSASLYLEVAARNLEALSFYQTLGYDCLNTVTLRKDFHPEDFQIVQTERIAGHDLTIKRYKKKEE